MDTTMDFVFMCLFGTVTAYYICLFIQMDNDRSGDK